MRQACILGVVLSILVSPAVVWAADPASTNFQIQGAAFVPAVGEGSSANYAISSVLDPIVGTAQSPSWNVQSGAPLKDPATPVPPPPPAPQPSGTGGGGLNPIATSTGVVAVPTLLYHSPTFASHQWIFGTYPAEAVGVLVNGSEDGVQLDANNRWEKVVPLFLGLNPVTVNSIDAGGNRSTTIGGEIERMLIGDVNRDHRVNDFDVSLFTGAWTKYSVFADFDEDGRVNDIDLSLLASHWNLSY